MTYRIKVPARTLELDEAHLSGNTERFLEALRLYRGPILIGAAIVVLAAGIVGGVLWYDAQTAEKAQALEHEALVHYFTRPVDDPKKSDANLKEAVALYRKILDEYPRTSTAPLALFQLGNALMQSNEVDAAIETYGRFSLLYGTTTPLAGLVQQRLGYAYLLKGDRDQAAKAYAAVLETPGALNRDHVLFELARLEESLSRPEGALAHYQDLMKSYPNSPLASEAAVRVKVLEVKKTPESAPAASAPTSK